MIITDKQDWIIINNSKLPIELSNKIVSSCLLVPPPPHRPVINRQRSQTHTYNSKASCLSYSCGKQIPSFVFSFFLKIFKS